MDERWEIKSLESKVETSGSNRGGIDEAQRKKETLLLARAHLQQQMQTSRHPRHREMLQNALADLELQLANLGMREPAKVAPAIQQAHKNRQVRAALADDKLPDMGALDRATLDAILRRARKNRQMMAALADDNWIGLQVATVIRQVGGGAASKIAENVDACTDEFIAALAKLSRNGLITLDADHYVVTKQGMAILSRIEEVVGLKLGA